MELCVNVIHLHARINTCFFKDLMCLMLWKRKRTVAHHDKLKHVVVFCALVKTRGTGILTNVSGILVTGITLNVLHLREHTGIHSRE